MYLNNVNMELDYFNFVRKFFKEILPTFIQAQGAPSPSRITGTSAAIPLSRMMPNEAKI